MPTAKSEADRWLDEVCAQPIGRPAFKEPDPEAVARLLTWLEEGGTLLAWCEQEGNPSRRTVHQWLDKSKEFAAQYARARDKGYDAWAEQALRIADHSERDTIHGKSGTRVDNEWVARSKLRVETRLRLLAVLCPRRYGTVDTLRLGGSDTPVRVLSETERAARLQSLIATAKKRREVSSDGVFPEAAPAGAEAP